MAVFPPYAYRWDFALMRILFVCLGNICRSPAAQGVFAAMNPYADLDGAGTSDWHVGQPPYAPMQKAALARGYDLSHLRARQFSVQDFHDFDLIIVMDEQNLKTVEALRPEGSETPVHIFTHYQKGPASYVPDPYYTRDFDGAIDLIEDCARGLLDQPQ